jgi:putative transposase
MWTSENRGRMAEIQRKTKRYPSDLTDEEWAAMAPLLPGAARTGRKRSVDFREILNAIRYMVRSGCEWRMLPAHFPPWQTVYWWFRRFVRLLLFRTIHDVVLMIDRERAGRAQPSAAILDSQSVKAPAAGGTRGFDGAKKIVGRKRHIAVDTDGRLLMVNLTTGDIADSTGAQAVLQALRQRGLGSNSCSPTAPTTGGRCSTRPSSWSSSSRSSAAQTKASPSCRADGSLNAPSPG